MPGISETKPAGNIEPHFRFKQCLIIRNDVKMSCGKRCAQAAHASIGAYNNADKITPESLALRRPEKSGTEGRMMNGHFMSSG